MMKELIVMEKIVQAFPGAVVTAEPVIQSGLTMLGIATIPFPLTKSTMMTVSLVGYYGIKYSIKAAKKIRRNIESKKAIKE